ncbi:MAG TPA: tetratricopeptide repeat protein [Roseimicrobium sp.]|nr:tetratricopeptide repeat protein [Roseimicrobium sp.]
MPAALTDSEKAQLEQTIEMFEVITQSQPQDYQSLEILKEAYFKLGRETDVVGTSKRIAEAYVQLGQLSSAILEYESILQRFPNDPDVQNALAEIENKATNFAAPAPAQETVYQIKAPAAPGAASGGGGPASTPGAAVDDGRAAMLKLFVEGKMLSQSDFDMYWSTPGAGDPGRVIEPFIQLLADKGLIPVEKSLKAISDKARIAYLPLDKYDIDVEMARQFPKASCQKWCVCPFDRMSKTVMVATTNPFNKQVVAEIEKATQYRLLWYLTTPADLAKAIKKVFR